MTAGSKMYLDDVALKDVLELLQDLALEDDSPLDAGEDYAVVFQAVLQEAGAQQLIVAEPDRELSLLDLQLEVMRKRSLLVFVDSLLVALDQVVGVDQVSFFLTG